MASAPSVRPPLRELLIRDIAPEGHRLLLPFLTTTDLLHLSECCQGLLNYRYHLSRVAIIPHPECTSAMDEGLTRLLSGQRLGVYIEPGNQRDSAIALEMVLEIVRSGAMGPHLKGLDVLLYKEQKGDMLCRAMEEKACIHLEKLVVHGMHNVDKERDGGSIMSLLAQGESMRLHAMY